MEKEKISGDTSNIESSIVYQSPIKAVFEKFGRQKDVSLVYGETIEYENRKVVPVAKVRYMIGGGGGVGEVNEQGPTGQGEGGGGHISVTPVGIYEITNQKTVFKPVIDLKVFLLLVTIFSFGLLWFLKKFR